MSSLIGRRANWTSTTGTGANVMSGEVVAVDYSDLAWRILALDDGGKLHDLTIQRCTFNPTSIVAMPIPMPTRTPEQG